MEKLTRGGRFPIRKMANGSDVSPVRSRTRPRQSVSGRGNVSRLGVIFAAALGIQERLGRRYSRRLSPHAGIRFHRRRNAPIALAYFREPDLVSDRVLENPAPIQS